MREILFRGKRVDANEWVEGYLVRTVDDKTIIVTRARDLDDFGKFQIDSWEVLAGTVGQFTGLHDKNKKRIWEGDILKHDLWGKSVIGYDRDGFRGVGGDHDVCLADHQLKRSRVIGNISDNLELLKDKNV